jgi:hypothetical protein
LSHQQHCTGTATIDALYVNKCTLESVVNIPTRQQLLSRAHFNGIGVQPSHVLPKELEPFLHVKSLIDIVMEYSMAYNDLLQIGN